jgi:hypothetical protein
MIYLKKLSGMNSSSTQCRAMRGAHCIFEISLFFILEKYEYCGAFIYFPAWKENTIKAAHIMLQVVGSHVSELALPVRLSVSQ